MSAVQIRPARGVLESHIEGCGFLVVGVKRAPHSRRPPSPRCTRKPHRRMWLSRRRGKAGAAFAASAQPEICSRAASNGCGSFTIGVKRAPLRGVRPARSILKNRIEGCGFFVMGVKRAPHSRRPAQSEVGSIYFAFFCII